MSLRDADELRALRSEIDRIDRALLDALAARMAVVARIGALKRRSAAPMVDPAREDEMHRVRRAFGASLGLAEGECRAFFDAVLALSRARLAAGSATVGADEDP